MLILIGKAGLDPFGKEFEEGIDISIPWSIDCRRPEYEERDFMFMGQSKFFPHTFAMAVG